MKSIRLLRSKWTLTLLVVLVAAVGAATLRAAAQSVMTGPPAPQPQTAPTAPADAPRPSDQAKPPSDQAKPPSDQAPPPAAPAPTPRPGAGRDNAKAAPEIRGSADNNVSFPVDI